MSVKRVTQTSVSPKMLRAHSTALFPDLPLWRRPSVFTVKECLIRKPYDVEFVLGCAKTKKPDRIFSFFGSLNCRAALRQAGQ